MVSRQRKTVVGVVKSAAMQKSVVVVVERLELHRKYKKYVRRRTKLFAHDERDECRSGDRVLLMETKPISKFKRWRVLRRL